MGQLNSHVCRINRKVGVVELDMIRELAIRNKVASISTSTAANGGMMVKFMADNESWNRVKPRLAALFGSYIEFDVTVIEEEQYATKEAASSESTDDTQV